MKETRTLIITGISNSQIHEQLVQELETFPSFKEIYQIKDPNTIIFVLFYDLLDSRAAYTKYTDYQIDDTIINAHYAISKYEIPRPIDRCDEYKNQGTCLLMMRDMDRPMNEADIMKLASENGKVKEIREHKTFQKHVVFYDSRCAVNFMKEKNNLLFGTGKMFVRIMWDYEKDERGKIANLVDNILHEVRGNNYSGKRQTNAPITASSNKNIFLKAFDEFIVENIDKIEIILRNEFQ